MTAWHAGEGHDGFSICVDSRIRGNDGFLRGNHRPEHEDEHVRMFRETCSTGGSRSLRAWPARAGPQRRRQDHTTKAQTTFLSSPPSTSPGCPAGRLPFPAVTTSHVRDPCLLSHHKSVILRKVHGRLRVLKGAPELPSARAIAPPSRACGRPLPWDSVLAARRIG
jgi:hypothetical protein